MVEPIEGKSGGISDGKRERERERHKVFIYVTGRSHGKRLGVVFYGSQVVPERQRVRLPADAQLHDIRATVREHRYELQLLLLKGRPGYRHQRPRHASGGLSKLFLKLKLRMLRGSVTRIVTIKAVCHDVEV